MTGRRKAASCRLIRPVRYGLLSSGGNRRMQGIEVRAGDKVKRLIFSDKGVIC